MDIFQSDLGLFQENSRASDGIRLNTDRPFMYLARNDDCPFDYKPIDMDNEESPTSCREFEDTTNSLKRESISSSSLSSLCTTLSSNNISKDLNGSPTINTKALTTTVKMAGATTAGSTTTTTPATTTSEKTDTVSPAEKEMKIPRASAYDNEHQRKTRKKWKKTEDLALMEMLLQYSHLLNFVEYFKPMKKFWIKISLVLKQHHGFERNARQCHDRFKVLYFKAMKLNEKTLGSNPDITKTLFLQTRNTFIFCNGNITLKSPPAPLQSVSDVSSPDSQGFVHHNNRHTNNDNPNYHKNFKNYNDLNDLNDPPHISNAQFMSFLQQPLVDMRQAPYNSAQQYFVNGLINLQTQIDVLKTQLQASERRNTELTRLVESLHAGRYNTR
ncbi:hypothetical protein HG535_0D02470 [Zygotorulaspora mrakii]|uniref:Myb-like domain-containing protein n=1 Tax=Zygotorulaspora mrakii TaxID=42260 RepID=A0A7H9B3M5_ZYGMR|nr:uncharacterized protein HG535_0D02470 [Zygotorulaspora mrakii]QLG72539.1 hypothetical protein HG535_0D02470 [Zygotorulaspora mrakii]